MANFEKKELTKKSDNFSSWYQDVVLKAELADYTPVKGCMVIRPYGYAIWENIQAGLDKMIKALGVKNAYFPIFIPETLLRKEKEHVKGFSPELAIVTIGGGEELKEKLIVRPTSETIMYVMYAKWLQSYRDLPILMNQWNNIVRWEKRTYLFLRTTEFLWQEGHTVHETHEQAMKMVHDALDNYIKIYRDYLAIYGYPGIKSSAEKFAGAESSYTYEILTPDGKTLQGGTSHDLGQKFAKVFNIKYLGRDKKLYMPYQTSWGFSTRSIGALIMVHGDDNGLILPPKISPVQIIIIPVFNKNVDNGKLIAKAEEIKGELKNFRVEIDLRQEETFGWKINDWEMRGVPLRLELGEKEIKDKQYSLVRRDNFEKIKISENELSSSAEKILDDIQQRLLNKSKKFVLDNTREVKTYEEFKKTMKTHRGFIRAYWCESSKCEEKIKEDTKATTRCLPLEDIDKKEKGECIYCQKEAKRKWLFGQSY
ncbi:MAG: proline--tRNA ligase [Candidatus Paceibacterota bacterium]|jgi:prolyl-tRNA synthetase